MEFKQHFSAYLFVCNLHFSDRLYEHLSSEQVLFYSQVTSVTDIPGITTVMYQEIQIFA